jgi:DNA invertase Pin-like site-specific DNA recombinase
MAHQETAVLYLRMSDERQERSIPEQRSELLKYAEKHGYHVLREYADSAISGDDTARRVAFLRMREDAQKGGFHVVLCWDQDRFGRFDPIEGGYGVSLCCHFRHRLCAAVGELLSVSRVLFLCLRNCPAREGSRGHG